MVSPQELPIMVFNEVVEFSTVRNSVLIQSGLIEEGQTAAARAGHVVEVVAGNEFISRGWGS